MIETNGYNWLDLALGSLFIASVITGLMRGFSRTVVGFATTVIAVLASIWFYGAVAVFLRPYVAHPALANFAGFGIIFCAITLTGALINRILTHFIKWAGLRWLDRLFGAGLGAIRAGIVSAAIVLGLCAFARNPPPASVAQSRFAPYAIEVANVMKSLAPKELRDGFDDSYEKAKKIWKDMIKKVPESV
jgi:membrane protein required for colicin V production